MCLLIHQLIIIFVAPPFDCVILQWIFVCKVLWHILNSFGYTPKEGNCLDMVPYLTFCLNLSCSLYLVYLFFISSYYAQYNLLFLVFSVYHLSAPVESKLFEGRDLLFCHWISKFLTLQIFAEWIHVELGYEHSQISKKRY